MEHNSYLKEENILSLFSLNNLIIPEIQREYVWGADIDRNRKVLSSFLQDIKDAAEICPSCGHSHSHRPLNIGFLYSYKPPYIRNSSERHTDEFVIDGQQRITTIFLLLLCRAVTEGRMQDFLNICRFENNESNFCFNYKVRNLTQKFTKELLFHLGTAPQKDALDFLRNNDTDNYPSWILKDYQNDVTVSSMLGTMRTILEIFNDSPKNCFYFDYILNTIRFWHFKTEATSQGEELYITMNSRGVHLQSNETQKADILPSDKLLEFGKKWEDYQDFFWKNRNGNENADIGFNNYLAYLDSLKRFYTQLENPNAENPLTIQDIESGMNALIFLFKEDIPQYLSENQLYDQWFQSFRHDVLELLDKERYENTDWYIGVDPKAYNNARQQRINSMLIWAWIYYYKKTDGQVNLPLAVDLLHFYYVRFLCSKRSSRTIFKIVDRFCQENRFTLPSLFNENENGDDDDDNSGNEAKRFSKEEKIIFSIHKDNLKIKSLLWNIQDLPVFRNGSNYGSSYTTDTCLGLIETVNTDNCLIKGDEELKLQLLQNMLNNLKDLDLSPESNCLNSHIQNLIRGLIPFYPDSDGYCQLWQTESPNYYRNHGCNYWSYIVRTKAFLNIYKEIYSTKYLEPDNVEKSLKELLARKRKEYFAENPVIDYDSQYDDRNLCIIFDAVLSPTDNTALWTQDAKRIIFDPSDSPEIKIFEQQEYLYITTDRRYIKKAQKILLPENWKEKLKKEYPQIEFKNFETSQKES